MVAFTEVCGHLVKEKLACKGIHWETVKTIGETVYLWVRTLFII